VHIGDVNIITIDGKRFERVRGIKQFYLSVPGTNAIVFVVDEKDYSVTYHYFNMDTDEDIAIHSKSSMFGHSIGGKHIEDFTSKNENGKILLSNIDSAAQSVTAGLEKLHIVKSLYQLDLKNRIVSRKTVYLDKDDKVIQERTQ